MSNQESKKGMPEVTATPGDVLRQVTTMLTMMQNLSEDLREHSVTLASVKTQVKIIEGQMDGIQVLVAKLTGTLVTGNGHSLMTRFALLEQEVFSLHRWKATRDKEEAANERSVNTSIWRMRSGLIVGILGCIGAIIAATIALSSK